jgi:multicomponent Na+:H+ antiporter subunit C
VEILLAVVIGAMYAIAAYLLLRRRLAQLVMGVGILGNALNLLIFSVGGLERGRPPIVAPGQDAPLLPVADPLPQALILTAIVIGFGVLAYVLVLAKRTRDIVDTDDLGELRASDR